MSDELIEESAEDLFENAPCGYITTRLDGTILRVNRTFEDWTGHRREQLLAGGRFQDLLSPGGRIYHETHYAPLLRMQGAVREIAVEIVRADGSRLPALLNSVVRTDGAGTPQVIRTTVFDARDRRRYEEELLRARREEQEIAQHLQRSMLSGPPPSAPGLDIEVFYRPADSGLQVGGDWYDAFWLEDGQRIALVVGDVVGRGIDAAATMGQLRSAVRALASTGLSPAGLLDALDTYSHRHRLGHSATLVYAELNLTSRVLRFACAGHPPPVIVRPGDDPCFAWEGRSAPLDVQRMLPGVRTEAIRELTPGSSIMLFTDGLVERRGQALADSLDELLVQVGEHRDHPPARIARAAVAALAHDDHADDVCLLVARVGLTAQPS